MDYTELLEWKFIDNNKLEGRLENFYVLIRKTNNIKPFELRLFNKGDIMFFFSFNKLNSATNFAQSMVTKYYQPKEVIDNIINLSDWRNRVHR